MLKFNPLSVHRRWAEGEVLLRKCAEQTTSSVHFWVETLDAVYKILHGSVQLRPGGTAETFAHSSRDVHSERDVEGGESKFMGLEMFLNIQLCESERIWYLTTVLPRMVELALDIVHLWPSNGLQALQQLIEQEFSVSRRLIASIVACSFFCLFPTEASTTDLAGGHDGTRKNYESLDINFTPLFPLLNGRSSSYIHCMKLKYLLSYFSHLCRAPDSLSGSVLFCRRVVCGDVREPTLDDWLDCDIPLCPLSISPDNDRSTQSISHIDDRLEIIIGTRHFAGSNVFTSTCSEEALTLFEMPELFAASLFIEPLTDNEALLITGVNRYADGANPAGQIVSNITGDRHETAVEPFATPELSSSSCSAAGGHVVCLISALSGETVGRGDVDRQFQRRTMLRELNKLLNAFKVGVVGQTAGNVGVNRGVITTRVGSLDQLENTTGCNNSDVKDAFNSSYFDDLAAHAPSPAPPYSTVTPSSSTPTSSSDPLNPPPPSFGGAGMRTKLRSGVGGSSIDSTTWDAVISRDRLSAAKRIGSGGGRDATRGESIESSSSSAADDAPPPAMARRRQGSAASCSSRRSSSIKIQSSVASEWGGDFTTSIGGTRRRSSAMSTASDVSNHSSSSSASSGAASTSSSSSYGGSAMKCHSTELSSSDADDDMMLPGGPYDSFQSHDVQTDVIQEEEPWTAGASGVSGPSNVMTNFIDVSRNPHATEYANRKYPNEIGATDGGQIAEGFERMRRVIEMDSSTASRVRRSISEGSAVAGEGIAAVGEVAGVAVAAVASAVRKLDAKQLRAGFSKLLRRISPPTEQVDTLPPPPPPPSPQPIRKTSPSAESCPPPISSANTLCPNVQSPSAMGRTCPGDTTCNVNCASSSAIQFANARGVISTAAAVIQSVNHDVTSRLSDVPVVRTASPRPAGSMRITDVSIDHFADNVINAAVQLSRVELEAKIRGRCNDANVVRSGQRRTGQWSIDDPSGSNDQVRTHELSQQQSRGQGSHDLRSRDEISSMTNGSNSSGEEAHVHSGGRHEINPSNRHRAGAGPANKLRPSKFKRSPEFDDGYNNADWSNDANYSPCKNLAGGGAKKRIIPPLRKDNSIDSPPAVVPSQDTVLHSLVTHGSHLSSTRDESGSGASPDHNSPSSLGNLNGFSASFLRSILSDGLEDLAGQLAEIDLDVEGRIRSSEEETIRATESFEGRRERRTTAKQYGGAVANARRRSDINKSERCGPGSVQRPCSEDDGDSSGSGVVISGKLSTGFRDMALSDFEAELNRSNEVTGVHGLNGAHFMRSCGTDRSVISDTENHLIRTESESSVNGPILNGTHVLPNVTVNRIMAHTRGGGDSRCTVLESYVEQLASVILADAKIEVHQLSCDASFSACLSSCHGMVCNDARMCGYKQSHDAAVAVEIAVAKEANASAFGHVEEIEAYARRFERRVFMEAVQDVLSQRVVRAFDGTPALATGGSAQIIHRLRRRRRPIVTRHSSVGLYRDDAQLFAMIQWCSASVAGSPSLRYHSQHNEQLSEMEAVTDAVQSNRLTVGDLNAIILQWSDQKLRIADTIALFDFIMYKITAPI